jgi:hypothetical protein
MSLETEKFLSRDDLFLLMKSYENSVQQSTLLMAQQQKILEHQGFILDKQKDVADSTNEILNKLSTCSTNVGIIENTIKEKIGEIGNTIEHKVEGIGQQFSEGLSSNQQCIIENRTTCKADRIIASKETLKEHNGLKMRLYGAFAGMAIIIISLISLTTQAMDKFDLIESIAKHLGLS